jgi:hypothetical protein
MSKLDNRKWKPIILKSSLRWYTGYQGDYHLDKEAGRRYNSTPCSEGGKHYTDKLTVKLAGYGRGRSAANFYVEDTEGYKYMMSMSGFYSLLEQVLIKGVTIKRGGYFTATFMQTKQGANYFIAPYEE